MESLTLPNGLDVKYTNKYETLHLYGQIFDHELYFKHGILLPKHAVVLDAGANIGLFTLFIVRNYPTASVHAFEPAPKTFQVLRANTEAYPRVRANNCGVSSEVSQELFTFLPRVTCGSGYYDRAEVERMKQRFTAAILADPEKNRRFSGPLGEELLEYSMEEAFQTELVSTPVCSISSYIDQERITRIDLLKLDIEGRECAALAGIRDEHWPLIRQAVIEVHTSINSLKDIEDILRSRGYSFAEITEEGHFTTIVYARQMDGWDGSAA